MWNVCNDVKSLFTKFLSFCFDYLFVAIRGKQGSHFDVIVLTEHNRDSSGQW